MLGFYQPQLKRRGDGLKGEVGEGKERKGRRGGWGVNLQGFK